MPGGAVLRRAWHYSKEKRMGRELHFSENEYRHYLQRAIGVRTVPARWVYEPDVEEVAP